MSVATIMPTGAWRFAGAVYFPHSILPYSVRFIVFNYCLLCVWSIEVAIEVVLDRRNELFSSLTSYIVHSGVVFVIVTAPDISRFVTFGVLNEIQQQFFETYSIEMVDLALRPQAFIKRR